MLQRLITSKTRVKLLTLFFMNPDKEMYIRELVRNTDENINSIRRELSNLEEAGMHSDIDLFIIGTVNEKKMIINIKKLEENFSREINYVLFKTEKIKKRIKKKFNMVVL
jgi:hypothetical protein